MPFTARIPPLFFPSLFSLHISSPLGVIYNSLSPRCRLNIYNKMLDLPIALVSRLWSSPDFSSRGHQQFRVSTATGWIAMTEKANLEEEEETTTLARRCRCAAFWNSLEQNGVGHVMLHRDAQWNRGVRGLGLFFFCAFFDSVLICNIKTCLPCQCLWSSEPPVSTEFDSSPWISFYVVSSCSTHMIWSPRCDRGLLNRGWLVKRMVKVGEEGSFSGQQLDVCGACCFSCRLLFCMQNCFFYASLFVCVSLMTFHEYYMCGRRRKGSPLRGGKRKYDNRAEQ